MGVSERVGIRMDDGSASDAIAHLAMTQRSPPAGATRGAYGADHGVTHPSFITIAAIGLSGADRMFISVQEPGRFGSSWGCCRSHRPTTSRIHCSRSAPIPGV